MYGGLDNKENLAKLTAEEHFLAHLLLYKIYPNNHKLGYAIKSMTISGGTIKRPRNKLYGIARKLYQIARINSPGPMTNKKHTQKSKNKMKSSRVNQAPTTLGRKRYNDGVKNYSLKENDPIIIELGLVLSSTKEYNDKLKNGIKGRKGNAKGKLWYNDSFKNYLLFPDNPKINELSLVAGRLMDRDEFGKFTSPE